MYFFWVERGELIGENLVYVCFINGSFLIGKFVIKMWYVLKYL